MRVRLRVAVTVVAVAMIMVVIMVMLVRAAADMMVMPLLRSARILLVADDLGAVFAQLAVHRRIAPGELLDPLGKSLDHLRMISEIPRFDELDLGKPRRRLVGLRVDALHQYAGEQEIREHDDAPEPE